MSTTTYSRRLAGAVSRLDGGTAAAAGQLARHADAAVEATLRLGIGLALAGVILAALLRPARRPGSRRR
jgi:threonine/homoserine efflux transporter RhtA